MAPRWSEIPPSFIDDYPDGVLLLTDAAYAEFLTAWLTRELDRDRAREYMVYMFSPREPSEILDRRIRGLTSKQQEVLRAFLTYSLDVEQSQSIKEYAKRAVAYASNLKNS